ncbi:MAG: NAD(+)/NADH kinase [Ruthenibacterium lactatiformans]
MLSDAVREYFVGMGQEFAEDAKAFELCDVIVTVGGDGTILHAARQSLGYNKPLLGINIGRMGFLATVEAYEMEKLERLVHGEYILDRRSILSVSVDGQNRFRQTALNDVVISKSGISQTVDVEIFCDDILVNHYQGDGVVIATPTGSTAYSLLRRPGADAHIAGLVAYPSAPTACTVRPWCFRPDAVCRAFRCLPLGPHNARSSCDGRSPETICQDTGRRAVGQVHFADLLPTRRISLKP